jgi:hypothetical protein
MLKRSASTSFLSREMTYVGRWSVTDEYRIFEPKILQATREGADYLGVRVKHGPRKPFYLELA